MKIRELIQERIDFLNAIEIGDALRDSSWEMRTHWSETRKIYEARVQKIDARLERHRERRRAQRRADRAAVEELLRSL
jgi:hypothetical protein